MNYLLKLIIINLFFLHALELYSSQMKRDFRGNLSENFSATSLRLSLSSEKMRYFLDDKISISFNLTNKGFYPVSFFIHKNIFRNINLIARKRGGLSVESNSLGMTTKDNFKKDIYFENYTSSTYHSRHIVLQPNETFSKKFLLSKLINLNDSLKDQDLYLTGYFYPNPEQNSKLFIQSSNQYIIHLDENTRNKKLSRESRPIFIESEKVISPKEIVYLALTAEYSKNWPNYFKFLSLKEIIKDYPDFAREYGLASLLQKTDVLNKFRDFLARNNERELVRFKILNETTETNIAQVQANATRIIEGFKRDFKYTFYLTKSENFWQITGISTQLVGR